MSYGNDTILKNSLSAMDATLEQYENSKLGKTELGESTGSTDISGFAAQVGLMVEEQYKTSLAYEICDVQPLATPTGNVFSFTKTLVSGNKYKFTISKTPVEVENFPIDTGFTKEAWDDLDSQFGKDANKVAASIFGAMSGTNETTSVINLVKANAVSIGTAATTDEMWVKLGEAIARINQKTFHTMNAWCIVPAKVAGYASTNPNHFLSDSLDTTSQNLVYKFGRTKIYVNPDPTDLNCYVGVNSQNPGHSSIIFSPYQYTASTAVSYDTGATNVFLFNRYAMTLNPLHVAGNEMICKFNITF